MGTCTKIKRQRDKAVKQIWFIIEFRILTDLWTNSKLNIKNNY